MSFSSGAPFALAFVFLALLAGPAGSGAGLFSKGGVRGTSAASGSNSRRAMSLLTCNPKS